jgi:glycosyltransferase involved in cell wall biosynthesis
MLSVIIPSYKDPYLHKTIDSILENATGEIEIIPVLDGYWPDTPIKDNPRINVVHVGRNRGMRGAINTGVKLAKGEYIMRTDEHCMFAKGFDEAITSVIKPNEIMTATRYFLDPKEWKVMDLPPYIYEKLKIRDGKFEGQRWPSRDKERAAIMVDETMAMQGSFWIMPKKWWDEVIGELQIDGYGPLIQDSHEMVFKTWKAGGRLMVNKNTWFAHKHYSFTRTHNQGTEENPANNAAGYKYCIDVWGDYYENEIRPKWGV